MYLTTAGAYLGWAYLPDIVRHGNAYLDGIVIDWESLKGASDTYAGRYDQGETATHEAGTGSTSSTRSSAAATRTATTSTTRRPS